MSDFHQSGPVTSLPRLLARPLDEDEPELAAAQRALEGFVRSVAKEIGRSGATANVITVMPGAESRLGPVLRFALSSRSAFITAQPIAESSRVATTPPCTPPIGLYMCSPNSPANRAVPSPTASNRNPSVCWIGAGGVCPAMIDSMNARPVLPAAALAVSCGSLHSIERLRSLMLVRPLFG